MYRNVETSIWAGPLKGCTPDERLLLLYLRTCQHTHLSGLYYCPVLFMAHGTGLTESKTIKALDGLASMGLVEFDRDTETVWVVDMMARNSGSAKVLRGVEKHLTQLHNTCLIDRFLEHYSHFNLHYEYPMERVSIPLLFSSVSVSDSDLQDRDPESKKPPTWREATAKVVEYFNRKAGKRCEVTAKREEAVKRILGEGKTARDINLVIWSKTQGPKKWLGDAKMDEYLTLETLLRPSHFQKYWERAQAEYKQATGKDEGTEPKLPRRVEPVSVGKVLPAIGKKKGGGSWPRRNR